MILIRISRLELTKTGIFDCLRIDFGKKLSEDLADIHILTGINGTGKSTILYALAGAVDQFEIRKRFINKDSLVSIVFEEPEPNIVAYVNSGLEEWNNKRMDNHVNTSMENVKNKEDFFKLPGDLRLMEDTRLNLPCPPNYIANTHDILNYRKCYDGFSNKDSELRKSENFVFKFAFFGYSGYRTVSSAKIDGIKEIKDSPLEGSLNFSKPIKSDLLFQWIANMKAKIAFAVQGGEHELAEQYSRNIKHMEKAIKLTFRSIY